MHHSSSNLISLSVSRERPGTECAQVQGEFLKGRQKEANCKPWYQTVSVQIMQIQRGKSKEIISEKWKQEEKDQNKNKSNDRSLCNRMCFKINGKSRQSPMKKYWLLVMLTIYQNATEIGIQQINRKYPSIQKKTLRI